MIRMNELNATPPIHTQLFSKIKASPYRNIINILVFYLGWTVCAYSGAEGAPIKGMALALFLMSFHLFVISRNAALDLILGCFSVSIGIFVDTALMHTVLNFNTLNPWMPFVTPLWILADYLLFSTMINNSLAILKNSPILQAILGAIGGALCYFIGLQIGAVTFIVEPYIALIVLGITWGCLLPLFFVLNEFLENLSEKNQALKALLNWLVWYFPIYAVQFFSAWVTLWTVTTWYPTLIKAGWSPPNWLFGPVWTILYILMAFGIWMIARSKASEKDKKRCILIFFIQLTVNAAWSYFFFGLMETTLALVNLTLLCGLVASQIMIYRKVSTLAALLQVPYFLWGLYALSLNAAIWWFN